jgi:WD40 repeat protein
MSIYERMLVVTGSADYTTYVFDISDTQNGFNNPTSNDTLNNFTQKLTHHSDIVYGVDFHPTEPILATSSGDGTVKILVLK